MYVYKFNYNIVIFTLTFIHYYEIVCKSFMIIYISIVCTNLLYPKPSYKCFSVRPILCKKIKLN